MVERSLTGEIKGTDDIWLSRRRCARVYNLETTITAPQLEGHEDCADLTPSIGVGASCLGGLTSCPSSCDSQLRA